MITRKNITFLFLSRLGDELLLRERVADRLRAILSNNKSSLKILIVKSERENHAPFQHLEEIRCIYIYQVSKQ